MSGSPRDNRWVKFGHADFLERYRSDELMRLVVFSPDGVSVVPVGKHRLKNSPFEEVSLADVNLAPQTVRLPFADSIYSKDCIPLSAEVDVALIIQSADAAILRAANNAPEEEHIATGTITSVFQDLCLQSEYSTLSHNFSRFASQIETVANEGLAARDNIFRVSKVTIHALKPSNKKIDAAIQERVQAEIETSQALKAKEAELALNKLDHAARREQMQAEFDHACRIAKLLREFPEAEFQLFTDQAYSKANKRLELDAKIAMAAQSQSAQLARALYGSGKVAAGYEAATQMLAHFTDSKVQISTDTSPFIAQVTEAKGEPDKPKRRKSGKRPAKVQSKEGAGEGPESTEEER